MLPAECLATFQEPRSRKWLNNYVCNFKIPQKWGIFYGVVVPVAAGVPEVGVGDIIVSVGVIVDVVGVGEARVGVGI